MRINTHTCMYSDTQTLAHTAPAFLLCKTPLEPPALISNPLTHRHTHAWMKPRHSRTRGCFSVSPTSAGVSSRCFSSSQAPLRVSSSVSVLFLGPVHRLVPSPPLFFCTDAAVVQKTHPSELCLVSLPPSLSAALRLAASQR